VNSLRAHLKKIHNQKAHAGKGMTAGGGSARSQGVKTIRAARESAIAQPISHTPTRQVGRSSSIGVRVGDLMADGSRILALDTPLEPMNNRQTTSEEDVSMEGLTAEEYLAQVARETYDIVHSGSPALDIASNIPLSPFPAPILYHYRSSSSGSYGQNSFHNVLAENTHHSQARLPSKSTVSGEDVIMEQVSANAVDDQQTSLGLVTGDAPAVSIMVDDGNSSFDIEDLYAAEDETEIVNRRERSVEDGGSAVGHTDSEKIQEDDLDEPSENIRILSKCRLGLLIRGYIDIVSHISIGLGQHT
jgi:hypothetical protein